MALQTFETNKTGGPVHTCISYNNFVSDFRVKSTKLASEEIEQAKKRGVLERKFQLMIREVLWQLILLGLMLWVVVGNQDGNIYYQNQHLKNVFVEDMPTVSS